ncbi:SNF2 family amine-terminal protein (macronuclear) [Tetrahymena thermophila SB210]|uniref:SNF2 family amine-terminal protein n=1 Tax=Tetrahymena thermophila (strain SB210) TaxID=312017 RepID=Q22M98_TETTS|nr:SNF2 family amine-terminal protein [Tetrahymena thermophila SB210]EAR86636.2 SNF2 family amine-terminal protein [Tetrahymena thermophila SB210]|eukprot:XP_977122.2 SNF2 family amine-terminal protein [Tetrahymena thermophila SB210]
MEYYQSLYDSFVAIVGEGVCTDDEIKKYIQWGNGNLEISLNYYFQQQTKSSGFQSISQKNQSTSIKNNSSQQNGMKTRQRSQNQQKQQNRDSNNNNQAKLQQAVPQSQKSKALNNDLSQQRDTSFQQDEEDKYQEFPKQQTVNAFQKLQEGSKKMREFDKIIEQLKEEYKKPVQSIVEKKLSVNKDEYSNDFNKDQIYQEHSEDNSFNVNLDYLPSILRRPNPEEAQIPQSYTAKPHIDFSQVEQKIYQLGQNEQLNSKDTDKSDLRNNQPIFEDRDMMDKNNQQNQNNNIKQEEPEEYNNYISNQQSELAQQQNQFFQERNKSYSAQSFDKLNISQVPIKARFQSETNLNDNIQGIENSKKKTQSYESFEQGIKDVKQSEEQSLQFPCYLGQFILTGHALTSSRCDMKKGDDVILKIERNVQTNIAKNKQKAKKSGGQTTQQMIIRLVWREREVGRLDNNYAQVLYPLIDRNYIFIQGQFEYAPPYLQAFTQIRVSVKVSLLKTCITKPITQIIEENSNTKESQILRIYSETKDQFAQLFEWLNMQMVTPTLIQVKGKKKNQQINSKERDSIANNRSSFNELNNQNQGQNFQNSLKKETLSDDKGFEEEQNEQKKNSSKMLSEDEERESYQNESSDGQKLQEDIFGNLQEAEQDSKRMIAEEESLDISQEINNILNDQSKSNNNSCNNKYTHQDATSSAPKINLNDPFIKLPKQKTLFSFKLQNKKPDQNQEQQERSVRQSNNQQVAENKEENKSQDLDYEQLFNIVPGTDGQVTELQYSEPPSTFKTSLHNYQKQALTWMLSREGKQTDMNEIIKRDTRTLHPLWEKYALPCSLKFFLYFNPYSGQVSTQFPRAQSDCRGGILADEMGLGKTVMMLSLIHSNKRKNHQYIANIKEEDETDLTDDLNNFLSLKGGNTGQQNQTTITAAFKPKQKNQTLVQMAKKDAGTLIIVPVTLLQQWMDEIQCHSSQNSLTYYAYYGNNRENNLNIYDVVITTYGTISSEFASQSNLNNKNLYKFNWHRIVLDEAHYIKGRVIQIAKAVYSLSGDNRWCMTGTPLQNKLDELFPLIHFIKLEPWSDYIWFNNYINKPHEKGDLVVYDVLKTILRPILLRRTKKSKDIHGRSIISLPEKHCFIEKVEFTPEERMFYDKVHQTSKEEFDGFLSQGVLLSNYMKVFELLLRLRQICDHIFLLTTRGDVTNTDGLEQKIKSFVDRRNKALKEQTEQIEKKGKSVYLQNQQNQLELLESTNGSVDSKHSHFEVILDENNVEQRIEIPDNFNFDYSELYLNKVVEDIKYNKITSCNICLEDMEDAVLTACLHVSCRLCAIRSIEFTGMCPICRKFISKEDIMTVPRNNRFTFDPTQKYIRSSKINAVMNYIQNLQKTDDKCLVFTQFLGMMDLFEIDFQKNKIPYLRLDGSVNQKQRAEIIKRFNEDSQYKVFMISLKAGGVGLNLVKANHVLMVDPWWNPAVEEQAIERCHRIGQKKEVFVTRFICDDSIESRMIKLHEEKRDLFENTIQATKKDKKEQNIEHFKYLMSTY